VIESALEFTEKDVYEIMVPGDRLVTLPFGSTPAELERAVARSGYSRFVITDSDGTYMGYLHVKDALAIAPERFDEPFPWYKLRSLDTLTPTTDIDDALASMQRSRTHIAQVMGSSLKTCWRSSSAKSTTPPRMRCVSVYADSRRAKPSNKPSSRIVRYPE